MLTGEFIILQNDLQDIFQKLINISSDPLNEEEAQRLIRTAPGEMFLDDDGHFAHLSPKYVLGIIEEYNRCLMEHEIP